MTSPTPLRRNAVRTAATLAAATLGIGVAAGSAQAEEAPYDFQTGAYSADEFWNTGAEADGQPQAGYFYANPLLEGDETVSSFRATLSVDGAYGITLETDDGHCVSDGTALICDYVDTNWGAEVDFDLYLDSPVAAYEQVEYSISVTADEYDTEYFTDTWTFEPADGAEDSSYDLEVTSYDEVEPGTTLTPEVAISNTGAQTFKGVYLSIYADSEFFTFAAEYGNCGANEWGSVICLLPDFAPEPGAVYELDSATPVTVTLSEDAPGPIDYRVSFAMHSDRYIRDSEIEMFDSDQMLSFVESERESIEAASVMSVTSTQHAYDLAVSDNNVDGEAGDETTLAIGVDNLGPAIAYARNHPGSGEGSFSVTVQLPTGVEVGTTDEGVIRGEGYQCIDAREFEWFSNNDPADYGVERIDVMCWLYETLAVDDTWTIELPVAVAGGSAADDGLVVANLDTAGWDFSYFGEYWNLSEDDYPVIESDLENNTAVLSLNSGGGTGDGKLPVTGAGLTVAASVAAAALAAGVVLFVVMRRRRTATDW